MTTYLRPGQIVRLDEFHEFDRYRSEHPDMWEVEKVESGVVLHESIDDDGSRKIQRYERSRITMIRYELADESTERIQPWPAIREG